MVEFVDMIREVRKVADFLAVSLALLFRPVYGLERQSFGSRPNINAASDRFDIVRNLVAASDSIQW